MTRTAIAHPGGLADLAGHQMARVGYGAMQLERVGPDDAVAVLRRAVELGVDHVDTAAFYGPGTVNALIRQALAPFPEHLVVVTKVGATWTGTEGIPLAPAQRPEQLRAQVEENLRTLGVDRLDVVNLRRLDRGPGLRAQGEQVVDIEDQLAELVTLREAGTIGAIGLSSTTTDRLRAAVPAGIACVQNSYNLLDRGCEDQLDVCLEHAIAWVPFFPLGSAVPQTPKVADHPAVHDVAARVGATPAQVGLAWLLAHAPNTLLIPGTASATHLEENLGAADVHLDPEAMAALDAVTP